MHNVAPNRPTLMSRKSIFVQCALVMAATTIIVAATMAFQSVKVMDQLVRTAVTDQASQIADLKAKALVKPLRFKARPQIEGVATEAMQAAGENGVAVVIVDAEGLVSASFGEDESLLEDVSRFAAQSLSETESLLMNDGLWVARPVLLAPEGPPIGAIALAFNDRAAIAAITGVKLWIGGSAAIVFLVMSAVSVWILKLKIARPLSTLGEAMTHVANGDYDRPVALTDRPDEIGVLARHLGELVQRLNSAREVERSREEQRALQSEVVHHLGEGLDALAKGLLDNRLLEAFPDEYERLRTNFNRALESLNATITEVNEKASTIRQGVDEIAMASDDLSHRTETQAATLEQTAAALRQTLDGLQASALDARHADGVAKNARETATKNDEMMLSVVTAMNQIAGSSEQINDITSVIDDIAFQTNLLALNAGVEAARAGSSGKGFAVVASEVRALAQRSSDAAQQIKELISGSSEHVRNGVSLVEDAGRALQEMVAKVAEISTLVSRIAEDAERQSEGLTEINSGITNLDQVTQKNAAMAEQANAASHLLRSEANTLTDLVRQFQTATHTDSERSNALAAISSNAA